FFENTSSHGLRKQVKAGTHQASSTIKLGSDFRYTPATMAVVSQETLQGKKPCPRSLITSIKD
ncbi:hypothetical protein ACFRE4_004512, partial [Vibrio vulnificus]